MRPLAGCRLTLHGALALCQPKHRPHGKCDGCLVHGCELRSEKVRSGRRDWRFAFHNSFRLNGGVNGLLHRWCRRLLPPV